MKLDLNLGQCRWVERRLEVLEGAAGGSGEPAFASYGAAAFARAKPGEGGAIDARWLDGLQATSSTRPLSPPRPRRPPVHHVHSVHPDHEERIAGRIVRDRLQELRRGIMDGWVDNWPLL